MSAYTDWTDLPLGAFSNTYGKSLVSWEFTYQFIQALQMRVFARCGRYFPPPANLWGEGVIGCLTNTELADFDQKASVDATGTSGGWFCVEADSESVAGSCVDADLSTYTANDDGKGDQFFDRNDKVDDLLIAPVSYDLVIGTDCFLTPWLIKRAAITSNGLFTIRFSDLGLEPDELSALIGKRYYIIQRSRLSWHERILLGTPQVQWKSTYDIIGETQNFTISNATGGTFTLNVNGTNTYPAYPPLAWNASAGDVASAINAVISGTATVTTDEISYLVTFPVSLGDIPQMTADTTSLTGPTGTTPTITFSTIFDGPSSSSVSIRDDGTTPPTLATWATNQFVDDGTCYVGFVSSTYGGYVRFGEILANGLNWITFNPNSTGGSGYTPTDGGAQYIVSRAGSLPAWYRFANDSGSPAASLDFSPFQWHGMSSDYWWTRRPDQIQAMPFNSVPVTAVQRLELNDEGECEFAENNAIFDIDFVTSFDDIACLPWDFIPSSGEIDVEQHAHPFFYRAWRGIQCAIESEATNWVEDTDYTGKKDIPNFVAATFFNAAAINSYTTTGTVNLDGSGDFVSYGVPPINHGVHDGCPVAWAVEYNDSIKTCMSGWFWCENGATTIPFDGTQHHDDCTASGGFVTDCAPWCDDSSCSGTGTPAKTGKHIYDNAKVYISYGWTRKYEAMLRHLYDETGLEPDPGETEDTVLPPQAAYPGQWQTQPKSTTYAKYQDQYAPGDVLDLAAAENMGQLIDTTEPLPSSSGNIRYMGDSSACITTEWQQNQVSQTKADCAVRGFFEGVYPLPRAPSYGRITASGSGWITDATQSWLPWGEWPGYSGTASGGSSNTIEDITVWDVEDSGSGDLIQGDKRWNTLTNRWNGFIVEITTGPNTGDKAPITATTDPTANSHSSDDYDPGTRTPGIITFSIPSFNWQYTVYKFNAANVEAGDGFTITVTGGLSGVVSFTTTTTSTTDVANGLMDAWNVANVSASVDGDTLELIIRAGVSCTFTPSTTNGGSADTQTLTQTTETLPVEFKIHEPQYKKNRWADRKLNIGTSTYTITASDNNTLWFDSSDTPTDGSKYTIDEYEPGRVYTPDGSGGWTKVVSDDDPSGRSALPDIKTSYGRRMHGDLFTTTLYNEAQTAIQTLKTLNNGNASWFAYDGEEIAKGGQDNAGDYHGTPDFLVYSSSLSSAEANFGADPGTSFGYVTRKSGDGSTAYPYTDFEASWGEHQMINANTRRARPKVIKCTNVSAQIDFYVHTATIGSYGGHALQQYGHYTCIGDGCPDFGHGCTGGGSYNWSGCVGAFDEDTEEHMTGNATCRDVDGDDHITYDGTEYEDLTYTASGSLHDHWQVDSSNDGVHYVTIFYDRKIDYDDQAIGLSYNEWTKIQSSTANTSDTWIGDWVGILDFPNQTAIGDEDGTNIGDGLGENASRGYRADDITSILRFSFPYWA